MKDIVTVGIIGAGRIGKLHAHNITRFVPTVRVAGISDIVINESIKEWAGALGIKKVTTDAMDLINDPAIDAILVCSSTNTHADYTMAAARAGKHVFCEKPIDLSVAKGLEAVKVAEEHTVKLQLGFNRRFDHNFKRVRDLVEEGKVGDVHIVKIDQPRPGSPIAGIRRRQRRHLPRHDDPRL